MSVASLLLFVAPAVLAAEPPAAAPAPAPAPAPTAPVAYPPGYPPQGYPAYPYPQGYPQPYPQGYPAAPAASYVIPPYPAAPEAAPAPLPPTCKSVVFGTPKELEKVMGEMYGTGRTQFAFFGNGIVCGWK